MSRPLDLVERRADRERERARRGGDDACAIASGRSSVGERVAATEHDGALDHVLELAHVARPRVVEQAAAAPYARRVEARTVVLRAVEPEEVIDEQRDVLAARAERRRGDRDDVEPVEEVLAEAPGGTSARRSRLVAATMRTSAFTVSPPTGSYSPSCSTRSSFTCTDGESSPISSRKSVPRAAFAKRPSRLRDRAGERAALVAEELGLEDRLGDRRAVDARRRARARASCARGCSARAAPCRCRSRRAPAPSPIDGAACVATSSTRRSAGLVPTISRLVSSLISLRSERFSSTSDCRSAALRTLLTIVIRLSGFSTKSYAPSRIAWTAVSTVPYAVISTTSVSGETCLSARSSSSPSCRASSDR